MGWNNISENIKKELIDQNIQQENWNKLNNKNKSYKLSQFNVQNGLLVNNNKLNNNKNKNNNVYFHNSELTQKIDYLKMLRNELNLNMYPLGSTKRNKALNQINEQIINMKRKLQNEINRN